MGNMMTREQARALFKAHAPEHAKRGVIALDSVMAYMTQDVKDDYRIAMDAQPTLATTASSGIPVWLSTMIDPDIYKVLFSLNQAATIFGERKKGTWTDVTAMFPTVEPTGETTAYGDYNDVGMSGINMNFPNRQSFLFQIIKQYGERELDMVGLAKVNLVSEIDMAAALMLDKFANLTYFFGVGGLINYGLLNDPSLSAPITPSPKAAGGNAWVQNGVVVASPNEIFTDIQSVFLELVQQTNGLVDQRTKMVLALSPISEGALTQTNSFSVNVGDLLKKNFPNLRIESAVQYGVLSASNPQGLAGGNLMQLIADEVDGQATGYCAFNEKMRAHKIIPMMSSYKQKVTAGTWGAIIRQPFAIASMQGI